MGACGSFFLGVRKRVGLFGGPLLALLFFLLPLPLPGPAHQMAAIMVGVVVYWISEPIPIPVTALLGPMLAAVLGIGDTKEILAAFGHPVIFLFIGSFFIAHAIKRHRLDRRLAIHLLALKGIGENPYRVLWMTGALTAFLSLFLSNTAVTAMLFPIVLGLLSAMGGDNPKMGSYATGMLLMIAFAASVGGIGTPIGTPPNLIGIGLIEELIGKSISFVDWMAFAIPIVLVMYMALYPLLRFLHPPPPLLGQTDRIRQFIVQQKEEIGPFSQGEKNVLIVFLLAVTFWILPGILALLFGSEAVVSQWMVRHLGIASLPEEAVAILASGLLFFLPADGSSGGRGGRTLTWEEASSIDWGTILLFGGGLALGGLMLKTGLSNAIGEGLLSLLPFISVWGVTALAIVLAILTSELASNTASVSMVVPVVIAFSKAAGIDPLLPALGAILGSSYGFMLPISTPPNAIIYGSGQVPITKMIRAGLLFDLIGAIIILVGLRILCPFLDCR